MTSSGRWKTRRHEHVVWCGKGKGRVNLSQVFKLDCLQSIQTRRTSILVVDTDKKKVFTCSGYGQEERLSLQSIRTRRTSKLAVYEDKKNVYLAVDKDKKNVYLAVDKDKKNV